MQTVGYWCDECRMKYVQHKCMDGLPCGHDKRNAIKVHMDAVFIGVHGDAFITSKAYESHEQVMLSWEKPSKRKGGIAERHMVRMDIAYKPQPQIMYATSGFKDLWAYEITLENGTKVRVGEWLKMQPEKIRRAFLERWSSYKKPPIWRKLSL